MPPAVAGYYAVLAVLLFQKKEKQKQKEAIVTELLGEVIMFLLSLSKNR